MRLLGAVSAAGGAVNEDGFGILGPPEDITAAWIFDGVTGINARNALGTGTDAAWLVARAHARLQELAAQDMPLAGILGALVAGLIADFDAATSGLDLPPDYDPPAACLILAKRYDGGWQALRLGDSCLLARAANGSHLIHAASPNNSFDRWLTREAQARRDAGVRDTGALLAAFAPQLRAARARRNIPGGYSILEASPASLAMPDIIGLDWPADLLLCTDGYYRAVDNYGLCDDRGLLAASATSVTEVLAAIRAAEAADPGCIRHPRFKAADDATAVMLQNHK